MRQGLRGYQELIANMVPLTGASRSKDLVPYMAVRHSFALAQARWNVYTACSMLCSFVVKEDLLSARHVCLKPGCRQCACRDCSAYSANQRGKRAA